MPLLIGSGFFAGVGGVAGVLAISGTPVLTGRLNEAYAGFTVSATGGSPAYTFSIASGSLPSGVTLNSSTGLVSGTPSASGTFSNIVIRVTDSLGATDDLEAFTLVVADELGIKAGTFTGSGSTGNQAVTGIGFQPTALFVFRSGTPGAVEVNTDVMFGATDGTNSFCGAGLSEDGADPSDTRKYWSESKFLAVISDTDNTILSEGALVSFDADGFTVDWSIAGTSETFHYVAFKGVDIAVGSFDVAASAGSQAFTGVGFQPKALLFFGTNNIAFEGIFSNFATVRGCAVSNSERWAFYDFDDDGEATTNVRRDGSVTHCIVKNNASGGSRAISIDLDTMDSDGFTLDVELIGASAFPMGYIAFGGGSVEAKAGSISTPTSTGTLATTGVGFQPDFLFFSGTNLNSQLSIKSGIGFVDAINTTQGYGGWASQNNAAATNCGSVDKTDKCFGYPNNDGSAPLLEAGFDSVGADGFTLDFTTVEGSALTMGYLALKF